MGDAPGIRSFDRMVGIMALAVVAYVTVVQALGLTLQEVPLMVQVAAMLGVSALSVSAVDVLIAYYDSAGRAATWRQRMDRTRIAVYARMLLYVGIIVAVFAIGMTATARQPMLQSVLLGVHIALILAVYYVAMGPASR